MKKRVCPWWLGYFLLNPFRKWSQNPARILGPLIREGMTVLEPGPGMGFFTLELLRRVGPGGRVIAIDVQERMLDRLKRRATKAGLMDRLDARLATADTMGIDDLNAQVDFTLAFAVVHEFPSAEKFFDEIARASRPAAHVLFVEPAGHVKASDFADELNYAQRSGFTVANRPKIGRSHAVLLVKR